jgi:hypothetical protein
MNQIAILIRVNGILDPKQHEDEKKNILETAGIVK